VNLLRFSVGAEQRERRECGSSSIIAAFRAVASSAWKEQLLWKKRQHSPTTRPPDGVELRCFLVGSRLHSLGFRSIAMCRERPWCMSLPGPSAFCVLPGARFSCRRLLVPDQTSLPFPIRRLSTARASSAILRIRVASLLGCLQGPPLSRSLFSHPAFRLERRSPGLLP
jgi:hypothetical protein